MTELTYNYNDHPEDWPVEERIRKYADSVANDIHVDHKNRIYVVETEVHRGQFNADGSLNWDRISPKTRRAHPTGLVYYIQQRRQGGLIKIGFTKDVNRRLATLETASSIGLRLLLVRPGTQREQLSLHKRFARDRVKGEWFKPSPYILNWIKAEKGRLQEPQRKQEAPPPPNVAEINAEARLKALQEYQLRRPDRELVNPAVLQKEYEEGQRAGEQRLLEYRRNQERQRKLLTNTANHQVAYRNLLDRFLGRNPRTIVCVNQQHHLCGGSYRDGTFGGPCRCECHAN